MVLPVSSGHGTQVEDVDGDEGDDDDEGGLAGVLVSADE
jgi:hypothetical protein